jgi:hypothetical protein
MKIQIIEGYQHPESRGRKDSSEVSWSQKGFAHMGSLYPVEIKIPLKSHADAHKVGMYELGGGSFKVNQYGSLELSRWDMELLPCSDIKTANSSASFQQKQA